MSLYVQGIPAAGHTKYGEITAQVLTKSLAGFAHTNQVLEWLVVMFKLRCGFEWHQPATKSSKAHYIYMDSRSQDRDFRCVYPCEIFLSHTPVPARGKDKKTNSRTLAARRSVTYL